MTRFDILSWHSDNEISKKKKKKKKKHFEIAILFKIFLSRSHMFMQLSTCFTYIYMYRNDDILRICAHECISFHGNNRGFRTTGIGQKFRIVLFPSNLNNCCNDDYVLCIVYFFIHFHFHWKNLAK